MKNHPAFSTERPAGNEWVSEQYVPPADRAQIPKVKPYKPKNQKSYTEFLEPALKVTIYLAIIFGLLALFLL